MRFIMRALITIIVSFLFSVSVYAQEMLGLVNSNYAGVNSQKLNPSLLLNNKIYLDINIFSLDVFLENNYLFIHKDDYSFLEFFGKNPQFPTYGEDATPFDHYWDDKRKYVYQDINVIGPSMMMARGDHAFALHTSVREITSVWRLPYHIANFIYEDLSYSPQHNIRYNDNNFSANSLEWGEIGISYATILRKFGKSRWTAGISINRLLAYSGAYMYANNLDYIMLDESTADIFNLNAEAGVSVPINYDNNDFPYGDKFFKGKGYSTNIGVTYLRMKKSHSKFREKKVCEQVYEDYQYRMGVSLIDLGFIHFNSNAQQHDFEDVNHYWEHIDQVDYGSINEAFRDLSRRFYNGDSTKSLVAEDFKMYLPTALSFQFDYHYYENWYFTGLAIIPVMYHVAQIYRPTQFVVSGRYESENIEVQVPLSLYNLVEPRIGLSVRLWNITFGSDNLAGFFSFSDFTGLNFYASLKLNFNKGKCFRMKGNYGCEDLEF